jgi:hypothetical protein
MANITFMCLKCRSSTFIGKECSVWAKIKKKRWKSFRYLFVGGNKWALRCKELSLPLT